MIAGRKKAAGHGFSLVEVVMAIGIISFALVALLGVTMVGTHAGREGRNDTDFGYVFEQISAQLRSKPFAKQQTADEANPSLFPLPRLDQNTTDALEFYLDDQNAVAPAGSANKRVRVAVMDPPMLDEKNAPSLDGRYPHRDHLACVRVEISPHPAPPGGAGSATYLVEICPLEQ